MRGHLRIHGTFDGTARLSFIVPGVKTSSNPLKAFRQGLADEREDRVFDLSAMGGVLCETCGHIDLYAWMDDEPGDHQDQLV